MDRTRSRFWCLVSPDGTGQRPSPLISEALISIAFVYSVLYDKLHALSRQDQGGPGQILAKQVKKFLLQVCPLGISRFICTVMFIFFDNCICCNFDFYYETIALN